MAEVLAEFGPRSHPVMRAVLWVQPEDQVILETMAEVQRVKAELAVQVMTYNLTLQVAEVVPDKSVVTEHRPPAEMELVVRVAMEFK
jgi:hypothetical protein